MEIEKCRSSGKKEIVTPPKIDDCTFVQVDSWNADEHSKSCDTLFIMSDDSGAYFWNGSEWIFLTFKGGGDFVTKGDFEAFKVDQSTRDDEQDAKLNSLENIITELPKITQIRTTVGISGMGDSDIFNKTVVSKADLLWTKYTMAGGNLILVTGEFQVVTAQTTSYTNLFWTTPKGFELMDVSVVSGQFVDIMQFSPLISASLNAMVKVNGTLGWSNYGSIPAGYYTINKTLRAI
ncbi:hypothetical protein LL14B4_06260 [Lactococcus lactis subsp. lactis]|uniref:Uncharacterized protein n=1 Tax=Lactococcus lactis subsp. lactis TaxID=1360 RepID=A0A2Z3KG99_LACLL|nr:hypothetical protein [Lactococcus lactis]AWN65801.1 hypothetical protein LL14B4_06260 [Lactococcus lactis subsp. lactis]